MKLIDTFVLVQIKITEISTFCRKLTELYVYSCGTQGTLTYARKIVVIGGIDQEKPLLSDTPPFIILHWSYGEQVYQDQNKSVYDWLMLFSNPPPPLSQNHEDYLKQ